MSPSIVSLLDENAAIVESLQGEVTEEQLRTALGGRSRHGASVDRDPEARGLHQGAGGEMTVSLQTIIKG